MQVLLGQPVHSVLALRLDEVVREQCIVQGTLQRNAVIFKHEHVVLDVLPDFDQGLVFQYRTQQLQLSTCGSTIGGQGNIVGLTLHIGKR